MGFNILRYRYEGVTAWGVQKEDRVTPFSTEIEQLRTVIEDGHLARAGKIAKDGNLGKIALADVEILSPVTRPTRLLALGVNYHDHREEAKADDHPKSPLFFRKDECSINSAFGDIVRPKGEPLLDYEVEMGLVIKKTISKPVTITSHNIGDYVAGMVLVNDVSAFASSRWSW